MKILFLHGWRSVPGGVKPTYLAQFGHEVINPALHDDDFDEALQTAQAEFDKHRPDVIVGSSRGGAVAMNLDTGTTPLVLLCPAWKKYGAAKAANPGTVILHSRADDTVPFAHSEELIKHSGLPASALIEIGSDHRLADPEPLEAMRKACERAAKARSAAVSAVLQTQRLVLRQWTDADLEPFCSICSDPRVMQFVGDGQAWSRDQTRTFIDRAIGHVQEHGYCQWALSLKDDGSLIGFCGFVPVEIGAEIGWRLARQHWGRGLATEAAQGALRYGFLALGFERVVATVQRENRASLRVVEKLGMHQIGTVQRNGRDVLVFAITKRQPE